MQDEATVAHVGAERGKFSIPILKILDKKHRFVAIGDYHSFQGDIDRQWIVHNIRMEMGEDVEIETVNCSLDFEVWRQNYESK